jgi:hypothetical protein
LSGPDCEIFAGILETFRSLGGIAENVRYGHGARGRGLFAIDKSLPVRIQVPRSLLFPTASLRLAGGDLTLATADAVGKPQQAFFTRYQEELSWAGGGRAEVVRFLDLLQALPERARSCLAGDLGLAHLLAPHDEAAILERFVRARHFDFHGEAVLLPVLELCNHWRGGAEFDVGPEHVGVTGRCEDDGEVLLRYSVADSWQRFIQYGFVAEERPAYALPMEMRLPRGRLVIGHDAAAGQPRNGYVMPRMTTGPDRITLSHLLLGDRDLPHGPRSIFIAAMRQAGVDQPAIVFDRIAHINRSAFLRLLATVEDEDGAAAATIRRLARLQLEALSFAVGAREI